MASTRVLRSHKVKKASLLRRLPPELRVMIYNITLLNPIDTYDIDEALTIRESLIPQRLGNKNKPRIPFSFQEPSKTLHPAPELLAALRADPLLYSEALVVFYKINAFPLTKDSYVIFNDLNKKTLALIQRISIFLTNQDMHYYNAHLLTSPRSKIYTCARNLRHVEILSHCSEVRPLDTISQSMAKYWPDLERVVVKQVGYNSRGRFIHGRKAWVRDHVHEAGYDIAGVLNRDWRVGSDKWSVVQWGEHGRWMYVQVIEKVAV